MLFDEHGVLLNNIAWLLRHLPVFAIGGGGHYRIRPIHVDDLAALALAASRWPDDRIVDAVGPERPTFLELVRQIHAAVGSRSRIVRVPAPVLLAMSKVLGAALHDVLLTPDEYRQHGRRTRRFRRAGHRIGSAIRLDQNHGDSLGRQYANELDLHFR